MVTHENSRPRTPAPATVAVLSAPADGAGAELVAADRIVLRPEAYDVPTAAGLVAAAQDDQRSRYGAVDLTPVDPAEFRPPRGLFLVAYLDDRAAGCGGYRRWPDGTTAELKRIYVVPSARRRGVAQRLLAGLEEAAAAAGCDRAVLDCGPRSAEAIALWRNSGYAPIPGFSIYRDDPANQAHGKDLVR
jgi:GNAT superfamily N-acetyltransferase